MEKDIALGKVELAIAYADGVLSLGVKYPLAQELAPLVKSLEAKLGNNALMNAILDGLLAALGEAKAAVAPAAPADEAAPAV